MKRLALLLLFAACLAASPASAADPGTNIRWEACLGDGGQSNRSFACNTNTGFNHLVVSFVLGAGAQGAVRIQSVIDIAFASYFGAVPPWWDLGGINNCRPIVTSAALPAPLVQCVDWSTGTASTTVVFYGLDYLGIGTVRIVTSTDLPAGQSVDLSAGAEYYGFNLMIPNARTIGRLACNGCDVPACIGLTELQVESASTVVAFLNGPTSSGSNFVSWQNGGVSAPGIPGSCIAATPTRRPTWGAIKSLYR